MATVCVSDCFEVGDTGLLELKIDPDTSCLIGCSPAGLGYNNQWPVWRDTYDEPITPEPDPTVVPDPQDNTENTWFLGSTVESVVVPTTAPADPDLGMVHNPLAASRELQFVNTTDCTMLCTVSADQFYGNIGLIRFGRRGVVRVFGDFRFAVTVGVPAEANYLAWQRVFEVAWIEHFDILEGDLAPTALTDNSGGTSDGIIEAASAGYVQAEENNIRSELADKINEAIAFEQKIINARHRVVQTGGGYQRLIEVAAGSTLTVQTRTRHCRSEDQDAATFVSRAGHVTIMAQPVVG